MIGLSLGESAGLFGVRAWTGRDEMYRRMRRSSQREWIVESTCGVTLVKW